MNSLLKESQNTIDKIIESKKLQLNYIWSNKITQEDINIPKIYESNEDIMKQIKITLNSASKLYTRILQLISQIFQEDFDITKATDYVSKILLYTSSLIQKIKNLNDIKPRSFKLDKDTYDNINKVLDFYIQIKSNVSEAEISSKLIEIHDELKKQMEILTNDL